MLGEFHIFKTYLGVNYTLRDSEQPDSININDSLKITDQCSLNRPQPFTEQTNFNFERRYKIEALSFKAVDETGVDWLGSDEVMIETIDAKGWTVSTEIDNIDSGDTYHFNPQKSCIVGVRPGIVLLNETSICESAGEPAPLGFNVAFWEKDFDTGIPGFCIPGTGSHHYGPHCANDHRGDDFIGSARIDYSAQALEAALPNVGDEQIESITLDPCPGEICTSDSLYTFTWRVTRLSDVRVNLST